MPFDLDRIGAGLPFGRCVAQVRAALAGIGAVVVQAPPGSGKTTIVPPLVANETLGRVVVTAPRRVVVRAAAARLGALSNRPELVGYTIRGDRRVTSRTKVEFVTPGVLVRRLLSDPDLPGTSAVILDEVHERGLDTDLLVGFLAELRQLRTDLAVVAMSATVDANRFAELLGSLEAPVPVVVGVAQGHPLSVRYAPSHLPVLNQRGVTREFCDHVATEAWNAHREAVDLDPRTDALVFVPGRREAAHVARRLRELDSAATVLELHGSVTAARQDVIVRGRGPDDPPRLVVSTSLAESALTVPGVRLVIDAGLAREPRRDSGRGMQGLVTVTASRASADQRAGRAARLGPGQVVRCYERARYERMPPFGTPEIATADLTGLVLVCATWGWPAASLMLPGGSLDAPRLPTRPPASAVEAAAATLRGLGALDETDHLTPLGRRLAAIPVDPRLGRALLQGAGVVGVTAAAEVVAALSDDPSGDLDELLHALRAGRHPHARRWRVAARRLRVLVPADSDFGLSRAGQRGTADESAVAGEGRTAGESAASGGRARVGESVAAGERAGADGRGTAGGVVMAREAVGFVVATAFPEWIARLDGGSYLLASGTRAALPAGSSLRGHEWLAIAEVSRSNAHDAAGTGALIRCAAALSEDSALAAAGPLVRQDLQTRFVGGTVKARRRRQLGAIVLSSTPVPPEPRAARRAVDEALRREGLGLLGWSASADELRRRLALVHRVLGEPWPAVDDAALLADLDLLAPELDRIAAGADPRRIDLAEALRRRLPWPQASRFDDLAPRRLVLPSGNSARIAYPAVDDPDARPVVRAKLQECFGLAASPRLVQGRVAVLFHLLSPAGHPLAVTDDLASFWSGPYRQVRAEMRGRYPKHPWPDDPWTALATARTVRGTRWACCGGVASGCAACSTGVDRDLC